MPLNQEDVTVQTGNKTKTGNKDTESQKDDENVSDQRQYPARERKRAGYLNDYVCSLEDETNIDCCYRLLCNLPQHTRTR